VTAIFTRADGTPFVKPRRRDFGSDYEYARAFGDYQREITSEASRAVYEAPRRQPILPQLANGNTERRTNMAKLRGKAKAAFLRRMAKGRRKKSGGYKKKSHKKKSHKKKAHHRKKSSQKRRGHKRFGSMAHALSGGSPGTAKAVKQVVDKMSHTMAVMKKRLEKECAVAIRKAKKSGGGHVGRKKRRRKGGHKKTRHHGHGKTHHVRDVASHHYGRGHGKRVTASALVKAAKNKTWTCAGPRRTGCGGGSRGGHVIDRKRR